MINFLRMGAGLLAWLMAGVALFWWLGAAALSQRDSDRDAASNLWRYATAPRPTATLEMDFPAPVGVGDPIFVVEGTDTVRQVGEIRQVEKAAQETADGAKHVTKVEALFYPGAPSLHTVTEVRYYANPNSMDWVVETMLPPDKRQEIAAEIAATYDAHHAEILQALKPVVVSGFYDAMAVVEQDLASAVARRRDELQQLGSRYQEQVVEQEIVPLVRREIWPIVRQHAEPLANQMGQEMWDRASMWRFGWRYIYDKSPLPEQNLTSKEWNRFLENDAIPVFESHTRDMVAVQQQILADVARNENVRAAVRNNLARIIDDPEFQAIVWKIVREALIDNPRLRTTLDAHWHSAEAQQAMALATQRIEPSVRRIGDLLFGTREQGITPEFARVLRNQILGKDRRWFVIQGGPQSEPGSAMASDKGVASDNIILQVQRGGEPDVNPFVTRIAGR